MPGIRGRRLQFSICLRNCRKSWLSAQSRSPGLRNCSLTCATQTMNQKRSRLRTSRSCGLPAPKMRTPGLSKPAGRPPLLSDMKLFDQFARIRQEAFLACIVNFITRVTWALTFCGMSEGVTPHRCSYSVKLWSRRRWSLWRRLLLRRWYGPHFLLTRP